MKKKNYMVIFINKDVKPTIFFLKSIIEPRIQKNISFGNLVLFSLDFLASRIENDEFERDYVEYFKKKIRRKEGEEGEEGINSTSPEQ